MQERGKANGAVVEIIDDKQLKELVPDAVSATGRAIWSPNTSVVKPIEVINKLKSELEGMGVVILLSQSNWKVDVKNQKIKLKDNKSIFYNHVINAAGLNSDKVAHDFGIGKDFRLMPFKGIYWKISKFKNKNKDQSLSCP